METCNWWYGDVSTVVREFFIPFIPMSCEVVSSSSVTVETTRPLTSHHSEMTCGSVDVQGFSYIHGHNL